MAGAPTDLRSRPFSEQIAAIDETIASGTGAALVAELADFRDHQPLAHALAALSRRDELDAIAQEVASRAVALPDTGLRRVLRALENTPISSRFAGALAGAARTLGMDRVAAAAMVDRWLKNVAPAIRAPLIDDAVRQCVERVADGRVAEVADAALFLVPGTAYADLETRAERAGVSEQWAARVAGFAEAVLDALEAQPKSLSQANAEELLARQVYTDPGHFLIELLQNADDAGATVWRVRVERDRVEIEHDGVPFDARDVVGILSIGQTTKSKEQIGFFGVGFKSVYDICERPQIYSGPFSFEIANVSVPRPLAPHAQRAPGCTLVVLPLRDPNDTARTPERLFERLATLPGEVLLTLNSLEQIDVRFGSRQHRVTMTTGDGGRVHLREQDQSRHFLVEHTEARYPGSRDADRAQTTPLLLAIALDGDGRPRPIGQRPTVYSFLPTGERSGLRFVIHAHFDLPVDRERLDASSVWNRWAIGEMAPLLSRAIGRLVHEWGESDGDPLAAARLDAAIDIVPLPDELAADAYRAVVAGLDAVAFLPGAGGERLAGSCSLIGADDRLVRALAGVEVAGGRRLLRSLDHRSEAVARTLGAATLDLADVVALLVEDASARGAGAAFDAPWGASMVALAAVLGSAAVDVGPLSQTPCLPDANNMSRHPSDVIRAGGELRALLAPLRPLIDEALQASECGQFLDRLGVGRARTRDLVAALAVPANALEVIDVVGVDRVLSHLANAQPTELEGVELACVAVTDRGELCPIGDAFLTGDSPLAALVRGAAVRPPLVSRDLEDRCAVSLSSLGCPRIDLRTAMVLVQRGVLRFAPDRVVELHRAIDAERDAISPALAAHIARAPIFPTAGGVVGALVGDDRVQIPADDDIRAIWPEHPWLAADVVSLDYVRSLGIAPVGATAVAQQLLRESPEDALRRAAFVYLSKHPEALSAEMVAALANAPLWPDIDGQLRPLDDLRRRSAHPAVARLYELWPRAMTAEPGDESGTAMHLAAALDIAHHVVDPDVGTALDDLSEGAGDLDLDDPALESAVTAVLLAAAAELPRARLDRVRQAPVFRCADGVRRGLGTWAEPDPQRGHRVSSELRAAFDHGRFPLLADDESIRLARLLDALALRPGSATDLVRAIDGGVEQLDPATASIVRRALIASRHELAGQTDELAERLSALAIWPSERGLVAARHAIRRAVLDELVGEHMAAWAAELDDDQLVLLAPGAEADAAQMADLMQFADVVTALAAAVERVAVAGAPLEDQVAALGSAHSVAAITVALVSRLPSPWALAIAVNAAGKLVAGSLLEATADELAFANGLPLYERLADPVWASLVTIAAPGVLARVTLRQIVVEMHAACHEAIEPANHPCLGDPSRRQRLYTWILDNTSAIFADVQARGALGKSCFVLSEDGVLRAPRELLFDTELPDLGIDWNPSSEVPPKLCLWLRDTYRPEAKQLRPLLDHMLDAVDDSIAASDGDRVAELVHHLARIVRANEAGDDLDDRVRRFRLRKRLRIETSEGNFERPRTLLAPDARDGDLVARFAEPQPIRVSSRYRDDAVLRLFRAAGAERELGVAALLAYLEGSNRRAGGDGAVALACYVASAASRTPSLRRALGLETRAWMSDQLGDTRFAAELYWPGDGVVDLVGVDPSRLVHPEIVHRAPDAVHWSGARTSANAVLADVAAHIAELAARGTPASETVLFWLDEGLAAGTLDAAGVRDALSDLRMFADDLGRLRHCDELVIEGARRLFGARRGDWAPGARATRLASALRIPRRPGKREVLAFVDQILRELTTLANVARDDSELIQLLPRCLDVLVEEGGRGPAVLPVVCRDQQGAVIAVLPHAADRVGFADDDDDRELIVVCAEGAARDAWRTYLRAYGVGPDEPDREGVEPGRADAATDTEGEPKRREVVRQPQDAEEEGTGLISRLRRWLGSRDSDDDRDDERDDDAERGRARDDDQDEDDRSGDDDDRRAPAPHSPGASGPRRRTPRRPDDEPDHAFREVDQRGWFRSDRDLGSQLDSDPAWLADRTRAASFGLAHAPAVLPLPYRYGPLAVFGAFDRARQSWRRLPQAADWRTGGGVAGRVQLRGRLPAGEAIIPLPLYGRVVDHDQGEITRLVDSPDGTVAISRTDVVITIAVDLHEAPDFTEARAAAGVPKELRAATVSEQELPVEVLDLLASLTGESNALVVAETVRSFVRERYVYDPTYLENPEVAAWLRQRTSKRSNIHVAALHAGRDTDHLGRGVCYELNALVCELMRRSDIPCAVAKGWTFDRGYIDEPDHLWAMALIDAGDGPRWLPLDASTTRTGRPLHAANRPPGPWSARARQATPPREPEWAKREPDRRRAKSMPISDLLRVARYIEQMTDTHLGTRTELLAACRALLSDPEAAGMLARILGGADSRDSTDEPSD